MEYLQVALTSLLSAAALFILAKIMGHRQISQLDLFDYINGITIGSIAAELATELEKPSKPLIALAVYGIISVLISKAEKKFPRIRKYINGTPTIIMNDGKLYRKNMKKAKLDLSEFMLLCRQAGYFDLGAIQTAVFEYNGKLNILPAASRRPATPMDMGLVPEKETIFTEVIMDGRVLDSNLKRMGKDVKWLEKQLNSQGYKSPKEIFLGLCDNSGKVSLYAAEVD
jgi:uncharacterized membrane protein YcaP (DUF421 family)